MGAVPHETTTTADLRFSYKKVREKIELFGKRIDIRHDQTHATTNQTRNVSMSDIFHTD